MSSLWRKKQLEYTWLRSLMGAYAPFWQVTGEALDYAMDTLAIADDELRQRLMQLYLTLDPFPEVPETLRTLKQAGIKTAIRTNGSPQMTTAACRSAGIDVFLDVVLSVDEVQIYKQHPSVYQLAVDRLGVAKEPFSHRTPGMPLALRVSDTRSRGAIATISGLIACRQRRTLSSRV